ncbi:hypothetical protein JCM10213v2_001096 [Rhodosporidiobolus nylandii]
MSVAWPDQPSPPAAGTSHFGGAVASSPSSSRRDSHGGEARSTAAVEGIGLSGSNGAAVAGKKRRKVKCDRKVPCSTCIRRGQPEACVWDAEGAITPDAQPFALATQFQEVSARLQEVEAFLRTLPPEMRAGAPQSRLAFPDPSVPLPAERAAVERTDNARSGIESELEKAVLSLENATFHEANNVNPPQQADDFLVTPMSYNAPGPPPIASHPEPTGEATSILSPPLVFAGPQSAVALGLELCFTEEQMYAQRDAALDSLFALVPSQDVSYSLLQRYIDGVAWFYNVLHIPAFLAEHGRFWEMVPARRRNDVDPAWLSLYFMVLALGLDAAQSAGPSLDLPFSDRTESTRRWYAAALRCFHLSDWARRPQFRLVQVTVLFGQFNHISPSGDDMNGYISYLAIGVRVAQKLRLHLLGNDPSTMPPDDPALPPGLLCFLDTVSANGRLGAYLVHKEQVTSAPLSNLNTADLSLTDWRVTPAPRSVWTESSLDMKMVFDKLVTHGGDFTYETVLQLDREARVLLADFPDALSSENARLDKANPTLRKQRFFALSGINSRLLRLHRPYVLLGYSDSRYRYSTDSALKAARATIIAHHNGRDALANLRIVFSHTLSAAIVVASNLFHLVDTSASTAELEDQKDLLAMSLEVFDPTTVSSPMLVRVLAHGAAIISSLVSAADERDQRRSRQNGALDGLRSFTQTLREIAKQLDIASSPESTASHSMRPLVPTVLSFSAQTQPYATPALHPHQPPFTYSHSSQGHLPSFPPPAPSPSTFSPVYPPAYSAQFLADMGLATFGNGRAGAFDPSHCEPIPPQQPSYPPQQLQYDASAAPLYPHADVPHLPQYSHEPGWVLDGQAGARALMEQIAGP